MPNYGRKKVSKKRKRVVKRKKGIKTIGKKSSVYKGFAKRTSGGLKKKDIIRTRRKGIIRYKSRRIRRNYLYQFTNYTEINLCK